MLQATRDRMEEQADDYCASLAAIDEVIEHSDAFNRTLKESPELNTLWCQFLNAYIEHRLNDPAFRQTMMEVE